jgi:four helix bundle protein
VDRIRSYRDLDIWKLGIQVAKEIYELTERFPKQEMYIMTAQLRRCAISVPSNVAEGFRRYHNKEYRQFLHIALGSCAELETQVTLARELKYIDGDAEGELLEKTDHLCRMISNLLKKL